MRKKTKALGQACMEKVSCIYYCALLHKMEDFGPKLYIQNYLKILCISRDYMGAISLLEFQRNSGQGNDTTDLWIGYCAFHGVVHQILSPISNSESKNFFN